MSTSRKMPRPSTEHILHAILQCSPDMCVVLSPDLHFLHVGEAFRQAVGLKNGKTASFPDTVERFSLSKVEPAFEELRSGSADHVVLHVFHHGASGESFATSYVWVACRTDAGKMLCFVGIGRAPTEAPVEGEAQQAREEVESLRAEVNRHGREEARLRRQVETLAMLDELTGLANRKHIIDRVRQEVSRAVRYDQPLTLLLLDIDNLNQVNDEHGRIQGDEVIRRVAAVIKEQVRGSDVAARFEGGGFLVLSPHTDRPSAQFLAERLRRRVSEVSFANTDGDFGVTISVGIVTVSGQNEFDVEAILEAVEQALEAAKAGGRNRVQLVEVS